MTSDVVVPDQLIGDRYRLERPLGQGGQGMLWLARDQLAADAPAALRCIGPDQDQERARRLWTRLQGMLHPQVPRFGAVIVEGDDLWLVREWQGGRTYRQLLEARRERQLVFGCGEVLLLLRQLLPVLAVLHSQDLLHGDLSPDNLLRRDSDGLPVLLDFGLVRGVAVAAADPAPDSDPVGATPGYAPPELARGEPAQPWMDLHALGVVALVLLSGDEPAALLDPVGLEWRWPGALDEAPALRQQLQRLLSLQPDQRFGSAGEALAAFQALEMPDSTGPVPRADRTVMLVPPAAPLVGTAPEPSPSLSSPQPSEAAAEPEPATTETLASAEEPPPSAEEPPPDPDTQPETTAPSQLQAVPPINTLPVRRRHEAREEEAEGALGPVLIALVLSAIAGTALGWWWLSRGKAPPASPETTLELPASLPAAEVDQRQSLLNRLRALQLDRPWFLSLVDASLLAQYPERRGRLPSDAPQDAPLRRVWNELAEEWLARVEQLPLPLRRRLGSFGNDDWERRQAALVSQGLSPEVLSRLVSGSAGNLLPGHKGRSMPPEPFRQLWYASAEQTLANLRIEPIEVASASTRLVSALVEANGARLFPIRLPAGHALVLGVNGTPLLQMSVFAADGTELEATGPLRVITLGSQKSLPVQLLVTNEGVAPAEIRLQLRADPPQAPSPQPPSDPELPAPNAPTPSEPALPDDSQQPPSPESPQPGGTAAPSPPPGQVQP